MDLDGIYEEIDRRNAIMVSCNRCLSCLASEETVACAFVDYQLGENSTIAVWICSECMKNYLRDKDLYDQCIIDNVEELARQNAEKSFKMS